ncbi:MAG: polysaccharide biosynthesis tyrosine autokinase [bacterium]|nr:polysaccharide biosynthesis tyrosine autokinase [bacterium]
MRVLRFEDISLACVFKDLRKNLWVVIMAILTGLMFTASVMISVFVPKYTSSVTFVICYKEHDSSVYTLEYTERMADIFTDVLSSDVLKKIVAEKMNLPSFPGEIDSSVITSTNMINVSVTSESPQQAYFTICAVMENYSSVSDYVFSNAVLEVISKPYVSGDPSNYKDIGVLSFLAAVGCGLAAVAVLVVITVFRKTVKTKFAFENDVELELFATVCHEKKASKNKSPAVLMTSSYTSFKFTETLNSIATKLEFTKRNKPFKTLMISGITENAGKTTTASNIALALVRRSHKVLLVDCDLRKPSIKKIFNINDATPQQSLDKVIYGGVSVEDAIYKHKSGLDIMLEDRSYNNSLGLISSAAMDDFMDFCKQHYDYVIIDSAPIALLVDSETLAEKVDATLLVVKQDTVSAQEINEMVSNLSNGGTQVLGGILTDYI